jgi:hypothetical protein
VVKYTPTGLTVSRDVASSPQVIFITGGSRHSGVFGTSKCSGKPIFVESLVYSLLESLDSPKVNTLGSHNSMIVNTRGSLDSPVKDKPVSQLRNIKNSMDIRQNLKSFLGISNRTRRSCLMKKEKSRDTIPLTNLI